MATQANRKPSQALSAKSEVPTPQTEPQQAAPTRRPRASGFSKEKILAIATQMFADRGFSAVSVRDIAQECGITLPTIYHFYGDKERLYQSCCVAKFSANAQRLNAAITSAGTPKDRIRQFTLTLADAFLNDKVFRRLIQREMLRREDSDDKGEMTSRDFRNEFELFVKEFQQFDSGPDAVDHAFSVYILTFALVQTRSVVEREGFSQRMLSSPAHLAEHVLSTILPHVNWGS